MMTNICCKRHNCVWCDPEDSACTRYSVEISEDGCEDYNTIFNLPEYQEKFWIAVGGGEKPMYRVEKTGKKIEYRDRVFYTVEQTDERESFIVTDGMTGAECGTFAYVKKNWDRYLAAVEKLPDVMTYPAAAVVDGKLMRSRRKKQNRLTNPSSSEFTGLLDSLKQMYGGG